MIVDCVSLDYADFRENIFTATSTHPRISLQEVIANPPVSANRIDSDDDEMDEKPKIAYLEQIVIDCIIDKIVQSLAAARLNNLVNSSENGKDSNNVNHLVGRSHFCSRTFSVRILKLHFRLIVCS